MKKLSLQWRLTLLSALLLALSCLTVYLLISNSALMRMDNIEADVLSIELTGSGEVYDVALSDLQPQITGVISQAKIDFRLQCLIVTVLVILAGSGLTWFVSGMVLKPLRTLSDRIGSISEKDLSTALPVPDSHDEIHTLTISFNQMLKRLDEAFRSQKQFSANAAHELRTPLAILQTNLEVFRKTGAHTAADYDALVDRTLSQTDRLSSLVNSLLELLSLHTVPLEDEVELYELTEEILCDLEPLAEKNGITLSLAGRTSTVRGNDGLIYRAVYNLIENAIKYNHAGGFVKAEISPSLVTITDSGSGIDPLNWEEIFRPFYRVDKARSRSLGGAGLGLALVSDIAQVHGGSAFVKASDESGSVICLRFAQE